MRALIGFLLKTQFNLETCIQIFYELGIDGLSLLLLLLTTIIVTLASIAST